MEADPRSGVLTGGEALVRALAAHDVTQAIGIPGTHNLEIYRHLTAYGVRHATPRHEQGAGVRRRRVRARDGAPRRRDHDHRSRAPQRHGRRRAGLRGQRAPAGRLPRHAAAPPPAVDRTAARDAQPDRGAAGRRRVQPPGSPR